MTGRTPSHHHLVVGYSGRLFRDDDLWMCILIMLYSISVSLVQELKIEIVLGDFTAS